MRWKQKHIPQVEKPIYNEELALRIWRTRGEAEYKSYLKIFSEPTEEANIPKLQIFSECTVLINAIKMCSYDKPKNNKPAEDVAEFDGDDPYDGIRYIVDAADKFFSESADEWKRIQKQQQIVDDLSREGDFTAYYRNMRTTESNENTMSASRYRH